ncbi:hypothetical protein [Geobacter sp. SVR]|uniref:hypothetical protein n=1 Tax=Geobacter sp. SVR TaxID=2495594 RepID=UPI00143F04B1|nr:hypothetical protein [Geobacter sp. SVR]BCS52271.1 hypothetical protein GSVR_05790 [Geobacter sp. SVR]GCF85068.1 hypothetical protein GSbR_16680 [Geobacter sp. SVR]
MNRFARIVSLLTLASLLSATFALADDNAVQDTFKSALYGGALGTLVGGALLIFTKKPGNHLDYLGYGAAAGVLAGTAYGVAKSVRALASIENGKFKMAMPTIIPDLVESPNSKTTTITWRADLLRGTF